MKLSYVQLRDDATVHDPAEDGPPRLESRRTSFASDRYDIELVEGCVRISPHGFSRATIAPASACRFMLTLDNWGSL